MAYSVQIRKARQDDCAFVQQYMDPVDPNEGGVEMRGKTAIIVSVGVVLLSLILLVYTGLTDNMVYYYHVDEFIRKAGVLDGETIKINGSVEEDTIQKNGMNYGFTIQGASGSGVQVSYHGVVPDTFQDGCEVVVEGSYDSRSQIFHATTLMAKCPTKYEPGAKKMAEAK